jgi:hypothetical protein
MALFQSLGIVALLIVTSSNRARYGIMASPPTQATTFSQQFQYIPRYIIICSLLIPHLLDSFCHFTLQNIRAFMVFICFIFIRAAKS